MVTAKWLPRGGGGGSYPRGLDTCALLSLVPPPPLGPEGCGHLSMGLGCAVASASF